MPEKVKKISKKIIAFVCTFTLIFSFLVMIRNADATLASVKDALSDSRFNTGSNHVVTFTVKAGDLTASDTIVVDFEADFDTTSMVFADISVTDDATPLDLDDGACVDDDIGITNEGTDSVTFTLCSGTTIADESVIVITFGNAHVVNPASATCGSGNDSYVCDIDITTSDETGKAKVAIISGITVTAAVDAYLTFTSSEGDSAVGFGTWTGGNTDERFATSDGNGATSEPASATDPAQLTVSSNGAGGVSISVKSINSNSTAGLYSTSASKEIAADASSDINGGTIEGFAVYASAASSLTIDEGFDDDGDTDLAVSTTNQAFAASAATPISGATVDVEMNASILGTTPAGSYSTVVAFTATPTY